MQNTALLDVDPPATALPKFERQRLHDMVVDHLRTYIVEGFLVPGAKLNERELCELCKMSLEHRHFGDTIRTSILNYLVMFLQGKKAQMRPKRFKDLVRYCQLI